MTPVLIDTHCHLDAEAFHNDLDEVVQQAIDSGVEKMLTIGITVQTSEAAVALADRFPQVFAVVGIQPNYASEVQPGDWERIVELAAHPQAVGIGETGLDQYWDHAPLDVQQEYFELHLQLSRECGKPFVVHCRDAEANVLAMLKDDFKHGALNGVMHSFCGDANMAAECVSMGMHISFAGMVTYKKNDQLREVAKTVPLERLLVETDSPYLAPHPKRGKRNEPAWVRHTAECLAAVHGMSPAELAAQTTANAKRLFRLA
ncbi:TatD family hydrolase [Fuerstiella marisgermanici]|uniref:Putative deoxyribonuclease YcfH n=1 Tax=Fuerstiella marisgermanici TaxID=1891926 RepID=A0A1P8WL20_9PLAN|nr:TatD family hydrolase [Fuerstiella marisgermanici]APZ94758.1 putative deoxyribonuclease YcfH [Fuerstiella marisgermanici]